MVTQRIALIHDWLVEFGGAEKILTSLISIWPEVDIFTIVHDEEGPCRKITTGKNVQTSFIQNLPRAKRNYRTYLPLMPLAVEQFDLRGYDIVFSISYAVSHGVITGADQLHINYICSPARYAWHLHKQYLSEEKLQSGLRGLIAKYILHYIRIWDVSAIQRIDEIVAISGWTAKNVKKYYNRSADVIYPPVDIDRFNMIENKANYYLTVSRLVPYKRINLIIKAFNEMPDKQLIVIGDGPDFKKLNRIAGNNITFLGFQPDDVVEKHFQQAKAFVYAAIEDFGIAPLEAQACGTPVIAYGKGGVRETVIDGKTGILYHEQSIESLVNAVRKFESGLFPCNILELRENAERFNRERFKEEIKQYVETTWASFQSRNYKW